MTNWLFTFLVVMVTPVAFDTIGWKFYLVWMSTNAIFVVLIYIFCKPAPSPARHPAPG